MVAALVWEEEVGDASKFYLHLSLVSRQEKTDAEKKHFFLGRTMKLSTMNSSSSGRLHQISFLLVLLSRSS